MSNEISSEVAARLFKKLSVCEDFLEIAGSYNGAFILEYCFYWSQHSQNHQKNTFYTKRQDIADHLKLSESTVKRGLKDLYEKGVLSSKGGRAAFKDKNNEYKKTKCLFITVYPEKINYLIEQIIIKIHSGQNDLIEINKEFHSGQNDLIHGKGQNDLIQLQLQNTTTEKPPIVPQGDGHTLKKDILKEETKQSKKTALENKSFEVVWKKWPRPKSKDNKDRARKKWVRQKLSKVMDLIILDIKLRWSKEDPNYVPMLSTYLNNKRWQEDFQDLEGKEKQDEKVRLAMEQFKQSKQKG